MALLHSPRPTGNRVEERIYDLLAESLDDEWQVWHEPEIQRTQDEENPFRPDFILLHRNHGLFVLEVKGWVVDRIKDERSEKKKKGAKAVTQLLYDFQEGEQWVDAPFDQLGKYKREIRKQLKGHSTSLGLPAKKINTLFDGAVAFANISRSDVKLPSDGTIANRLSSKLASVLLKRGQRAFYKSEIKTWEECRESVARDLSASNGGLALSPEMIDTIRGVIHPEILLPTPPNPRGVARATTGPVKPDAPPPVQQEIRSEKLRVLSQPQENVARYGIGSGHRILFGVAGSGKTMILIARARWQAMLNPAHRILVLCYNRTLSLYIAKVLEEYANINAMTFHAWVREELHFKLKFDHPNYDGKLLDHLRKRGANQYDSILIDECQDWEPDWFKAVLFAAKDPEQGDLLVVGDGSQSIRKKHSNFNWENCGINPQPWRGYDGGVGFIFDRNYRNSPQIVALASSFLIRDGVAREDSADNAILSLIPDPEKCIREGGPKPELGCFLDRTREMEFVATNIRRLIDSNDGLEPCDFAVVYPGFMGAIEAETQFGALFESLTEMSIPHVHVQGGKTRNQHMLLEGNSVKILNVQQMKGLEQRICFIVGIDEYKNGDENLLYVAMTRATDQLFLSWLKIDCAPVVVEQKNGPSSNLLAIVSKFLQPRIIDRLTADSSLFTLHEDSQIKK